MNPVSAALLVGAGGFAGSILRYALGLSLQRFSLTFPHGTLWVNIIGCFAIGLIAALSERSGALSPAARLLLTTGLCGGFTTMSSFMYEIAQFLRDREYLHAAGYAGLTLAGSLLAFGLGWMLVRWMVQPGGSYGTQG